MLYLICKTLNDCWISTLLVYNKYMQGKLKKSRVPLQHCREWYDLLVWYAVEDSSTFRYTKRMNSFRFFVLKELWFTVVYVCDIISTTILVILSLAYLFLQWSPKDNLSAPISSAIYSCDGLLVYTAFCDGAIGVFDADSLRLRCRIAPSAYMSGVSVG